jgi:uncharacterized membrane protein YagU involved in acid resistance
MPPVGFEPTIPASARPQIYALDRAAIGIGIIIIHLLFSFVVAILYMSLKWNLQTATRILV